MEQPFILYNSEVMGGTGVFDRTRVPVQPLLDYLEGDEIIDYFSKGSRMWLANKWSLSLRKRRTD
jgi:hypothetical protein